MCIVATAAGKTNCCIQWRDTSDTKTTILPPTTADGLVYGDLWQETLRFFWDHGKLLKQNPCSKKCICKMVLSACGIAKGNLDPIYLTPSPSVLIAFYPGSLVYIKANQGSYHHIFQRHRKDVFILSFLDMFQCPSVGGFKRHGNIFPNIFCRLMS